jgi:LmbE family N-acetylglucosaminyl deacetylase
MTLKLLCLFAHPDDESLGMGGTLAKYAAEGVETYLVCATRGERGWMGEEKDNPGLEALGRLREGELRAACAVLGIRDVQFLDYLDGDLDQAPPAEAIAKLVSHLRRVRPQVVVTFGPEGAYGHPDHIAICQFTHAALVRAADAAHPDPQPPHVVSKLYYAVDSRDFVAYVESFLGPIVMGVDGETRRHPGWEEWSITTRVDASAHWQTALQAINCHRSQVAQYGLDELTDDQHRRIWGRGTFYRALSLVNGGRAVETDLFEGLR